MKHVAAASPVAEMVPDDTTQSQTQMQMQTQLQMRVPPTESRHVATKEYVDAADAALGARIDAELDEKDTISDVNAKLALKANASDLGNYALQSSLTSGLAAKANATDLANNYYNKTAIDGTIAAVNASIAAKAPTVNYSATPQPTGQTFNGAGSVYRKLVAFGALPDNATKSVAHGISSGALKVGITGTARTAAGMTIPIPYAGAYVDEQFNIQISVDSANVIITTSTDNTNFTECYVVIEYVSP